MTYAAVSRTGSHCRLVYTGIAALLLATTACTQPPAQVVLRGQNSYKPEGVIRVADAARAASVSTVSPVSAPVYVPQETQQSASVESIGVSDVPPPVASAPAPEAANAPEVVKADEVKTVAENKTQPVNLWTGEPHFTGKPAAESTVKTTNGEAPTALLGQNMTAAQSVNYMWPVSSKKIVNGFGPKAGGRVSDGLDIASASGEPVWASADGEIVFVGDELKGYGNMVLIKHADGKTTTYAHLGRAAVDKYDRVKQGDIIGYVGSTGNVRDPQLYFAINEGKTALDPQKFLSSRVAGL